MAFYFPLGEGTQGRAYINEVGADGKPQMNKNAFIAVNEMQGGINPDTGKNYTELYRVAFDSLMLDAISQVVFGTNPKFTPVNEQAIADGGQLNFGGTAV